MLFYLFSYWWKLPWSCFGAIFPASWAETSLVQTLTLRRAYGQCVPHFHLQPKIHTSCNGKDSGWPLVHDLSVSTPVFFYFSISLTTNWRDDPSVKHTAFFTGGISTLQTQITRWCPWDSLITIHCSCIYFYQKSCPHIPQTLQCTWHWAKCPCTFPCAKWSQHR